VLSVSSRRLLIYSEYDDQAERSSTYIDKEAATLAVQTGRYFAQYLVYVAIAYGVMLAKITKHDANRQGGF
jgi:hypothetical protein